MTDLTLQVIFKNPPVTLHEICKKFSKISRSSCYSMFWKFGCPSQECLPKCKEHLFLMTIFKVCHMCREHGKGSSKLGKVEGASVNVWKRMGDSLRKGKRGIWGTP